MNATQVVGAQIRRVPVNCLPGTLQHFVISGLIGLTA
jgi:hypothetical protein